MPQASLTIPDSSGVVFLTNINAALAALDSGNSDGTTAPADPVAGRIWVKPVSGTVFQVYRYDGTQWTLLYQINPTTGKLYNADGVRRQYCGVATGTADVITLSTTPAIAAYEDGQRFVFVTSGANTGAVTVNVDSVGASALKLEGQDPGAGDLASGALVEIVRYNSLFHIVGGASRTATTSLAGKVRKADETAFLAATADRFPDSAVVKKHARERLYANRTYYVRADGSDSNTGLANTSGGAWLTLQKAWDVIQQTLDLNGYTVTVQIGDGTYTAGVVAECLGVGQDSATGIVFQGNSGTPANVIISTTSAHCFWAHAGALFVVKDMELRTTTSGNCLQATDNGSIRFQNVRFGACADNHCYADDKGLLTCLGSYTISGSAERHIYLIRQGVFSYGTATVTLTGTPAFSSFFCSVNQNATLHAAAATYSGAATGARYRVEMNGTIFTNGGGASFFPGDSAGSSATGGQYN